MNIQLLARRSIRAIKAFTLLSASILIIGQSSSQDASKEVEIPEGAFRCLTAMEKSELGIYFVDNVLGNLQGTLDVANSDVGGDFPAGSLISMVPTEVMLKHNEGWNEATDDWEFFELNVSAEGSEIISRGTTDVINRFGGNCFGCHTLAREEWDLICSDNHGCAPLPITRDVIANIQNTDPRCISNEEDA